MFWLDVKDIISFWPTGGALRAHTAVAYLPEGFIIIKHMITYFIPYCLFIGFLLHESVVFSESLFLISMSKRLQHYLPGFKINQKFYFFLPTDANNLWTSLSRNSQVCCTPTWHAKLLQWGAAPWDLQHKECSVRMQQEHFGKYSVLEQGKSVADRQALTSLTAQSLSRLLIPPDINSRPCFTFTSICRERRRLQKLSAISDFSLFRSKLSLSWPLLCVCRSPFTLFLTFSATFPLSLSSLPPHSVILFWGSAETSSSLLLCSPILFQVYIWSLYVNTARCKQAALVGQPSSITRWDFI